jgi:hypothetical protein
MCKFLDMFNILMLFTALVIPKKRKARRRERPVLAKTTKARKDVSFCSVFQIFTHGVNLFSWYLLNIRDC